MAESWERRGGRAGRRWMRRTRLPPMLAILFGLLFALEIVVEANGHSIDPTDPENYNSYALRNDTAAQLYVHLCADPRCAGLDGHFDWVPVRPGAADGEQVYWGDSTPAVYAVSSTTKGTGARRCLVLDTSKKSSATVDSPLSSAARCAG